MTHPLLGIRPSSMINCLRNEVESGMLAHCTGTGVFGGLDLFDYTKQCTAAKAWNPNTTVASGSVVDLKLDPFITLPFHHPLSGESDRRPIQRCRHCLPAWLPGKRS